jgi:ribonuclease PH
VLTEGGDFVEVQGSGEEATFTQAQMDAMLVLARKGVTELCALQQQIIDSAMKPAQPTDLKKLADFFGKK